jgi:hypothetical protein
LNAVRESSVSSIFFSERAGKKFCSAKRGILLDFLPPVFYKKLFRKTWFFIKIPIWKIGGFCGRSVDFTKIHRLPISNPSYSLVATGPQKVA